VGKPKEPIYGPYQSERDAHEAVLRMAGPGDPPMPSVLSPDQKGRLLQEACYNCGLVLGEHDKRVLARLAEFPDSTVAVIAGLISRARGRAQKVRGGPGQDEDHALAHCPECGCPSAYYGMKDGEPGFQCPSCYCLFTVDPVMLEWQYA
jgi:hypothetical protein